CLSCPALLVPRDEDGILSLPPQKAPCSPAAGCAASPDPSHGSQDHSAIHTVPEVWDPADPAPHHPAAGNISFSDGRQRISPPVLSWKSYLQTPEVPEDSRTEISLQLHCWSCEVSVSADFPKQTLLPVLSAFQSLL